MMNEREIAVTSVNRALPVFEKINNLYLRASAISQRQEARETVQRNPAKRKGQALMRTVLVFFVMEMLYGVYQFLLDTAHRAFNLPDMLCWLLGILWVMLTFWVTIRTYQRGKAPNKTEDEELQKARNSMEEQLQGISNEIYEVFTENEEIISHIPRDYRNYDAVSYFEKVLANEKADSMKEAMLLYDEYIHRQALEFGNTRMQNIAQQQSAMLANIETMSGRTELNTRISAGFSVLNFLSNL